MIENMNDFISLAVMIAVIVACLIFMISVFSQHHAKKIQQLEDEYYNFTNDNDDSDDYD
ncbi:MAG: hypothetical protein MR210_07725 [Erysipelotrichaceae bacterium]|nr:hypothetical protein [Erysipelotrichaceae bacterium]MDY5251309.1 hypothetical protein [Erysipelotrichaceae bacterium]